MLAVESSTSVTFEETSPKSAENVELQNAQTSATINDRQANLWVATNARVGGGAKLF